MQICIWTYNLIKESSTYILIRHRHILAIPKYEYGVNHCIDICRMIPIHALYHRHAAFIVHEKRVEYINVVMTLNVFESGGSLNKGLNIFFSVKNMIVDVVGLAIINNESDCSVNDKIRKVEGNDTAKLQIMIMKEIVFIEVILTGVLLLGLKIPY
eukprot:762415-Hanusia_phi.AAC.1